MKTNDVEKKFLENAYQNYNKINDELNELYKNKKNNLEQFIKDIHDKYILAILNISIYEAVINENYEILYNGIYTYAHLRNLNRSHLNGFGFNNFIEHLIINENEFEKINDWKGYVVKRFEENFGDQMTGKFDMELLNFLRKNVSGEDDIDVHFNNLLKLHSKCQWLTKGWYRESNLINYMPIYLVGLYKFAGKKIKMETDNKCFMGFIEYIEKNKNKENKLVYNFTGKIKFLNKILDKEYYEYKKNGVRPHFI